MFSSNVVLWGQLCLELVQLFLMGTPVPFPSMHQERSGEFTLSMAILNH